MLLESTCMVTGTGRGSVWYGDATIFEIVGYKYDGDTYIN